MITFLLSGPCAIEGGYGYAHNEHIVTVTDKLNIPYVFKVVLKRLTAVIDSFTEYEKALKILKVSKPLRYQQLLIFMRLLMLAWLQTMLMFYKYLLF